MAEKLLMKGNEAIGEAAIRSGCRCYFGYPITPQNELIAYMARKLPQCNGVFVQSESEVAAINMVYGAASTGTRVMTSSSSPGISLKQEGISYIAAAELPCVIINVMRSGPGLGNIGPSQSDYFQAVKGGGHGDYHLIVLAPATVQEMADLTAEAFRLAELYRNPVMIMCDGILGQMMEPVHFGAYDFSEVGKEDWAVGVSKGRKPNVVTSILMSEECMENHNLHLQEKYKKIALEQTRHIEENTQDADILLIAYGTSARIARTVMMQAREEGVKVGLIRPVTLWPFPSKVIHDYADKGKKFIVIEMSAGQMVEDVRLAAEDGSRVRFYGRMGGMVPSPADVLEVVREVWKECTL